MINVSAEFKELMQTRTDFKQYAEMTLTDGAVWALDAEDFTIANNSITDAAESNSLPLGAAISRTIQIELMNDDDRFAQVDFMGARIRLYMTFELSETAERIEMGTFTVISPETYGETVIVSAVDDMWKLDKDYSTNLTFPQTIGAIFRDICTRCSVTPESATFNNYDFVVDTLPEQTGTYRQMIGYIAMIAGGNARFNRLGNLEILTYSFPSYTTSEEINYDGGNFTDWESGDTLDGGNFSDSSSGDSADGGGFDPWSASGGADSITTDENTHVLTDWINLKMETEDIIITGIQTTKTETDADGNETQSSVLYGAEGYVISVENPLISGRESEAVTLIGDVLVGAAIRKFEGDHIAYPLAEFMDKAVITDRKGNTFGTVLTDINFAFNGMTTMKNSAESPLRLSSKYNSAAAKAVIEAKKMVKKERTQREEAIKNLNETLGAGNGLYTTSEEQSDGSVISYLHDKPTLAESQTVIKVTAEAIGVSNDGGNVYSYAFFTNGDAILKILQAEGINADWINAGALTISDADGNVLFSADIDTKSVNITGNILQIISDYFTLTKEGKIASTGGTIGGFNVTNSTLESEGGYGIKLDSANGLLDVGGLRILAQGNNVGHIGLEGSYIFFSDLASGNFGVTLYAAEGKKIRAGSDMYFEQAAEFAKMPTLPEALPISMGGTGKDSFSKFAVLAGNGTDPVLAISTYSGAFYAEETGGYPSFGTLPIPQGGTGGTTEQTARNNLGIYSGTASITPSASTYADSASISLPNVDDYAITVTPRGSTGVGMQCSVRNNGTNAFYVRVHKVDSWSGGSWNFDWIAVKKNS